MFIGALYVRNNCTPESRIDLFFNSVHKEVAVLRSVRLDISSSSREHVVSSAKISMYMLGACVFNSAVTWSMQNFWNLWMEFHPLYTSLLAACLWLSSRENKILEARACSDYHWSMKLAEFLFKPHIFLFLLAGFIFLPLIFIQTKVCWLFRLIARSCCRY